VPYVQVHGRAMQTTDKSTTRRPRRSRWGRRLLFVIIVGGVAGFALTRYEMRPVPVPIVTPRLSVFQATMEQAYPTIVRAAKLTASQIPGGESMPAGQLMSAAASGGFRRLDDPSLAQLVLLSAELAQRADPETCAMLWSGGAGAAFVPAIEKLPADQQHKWARIFDHAALASIEGLPLRPPPTATEFQEALNRTMLRSPPSDLNAIKAVVEDGEHQDAAQKCDAARAMYAALLRTDYDDAVTIERGLLNR
jgi:hypothetical protein